MLTQMQVWSAYKKGDRSGAVIVAMDDAQYALSIDQARQVAVMITQAADQSERVQFEMGLTETDPYKIVHDLFPGTTVEHPLDDNEVTDG